MKVITRPTLVAVLLLIALTTTAVAQQKRQTPARPQPKAAPATPPPTFDTLVPSERYVIYGEVRGVGNVVRTPAINEALEPILKLSGPPKEFRTIVKWLNAHADELMTSRLLVATWPTTPDVPEAIIAIEFASAEEATKFLGPLNTFLTSVIPPVNEPSETRTETSKTTVESKPNYHIQQAGSLIVLTQKPLNLKQFKPAGNKPLSEDVNFRTARNRFSSEAAFVFINMKLIEREEEERRKQSEAAQKQAVEELLKQQAEAEAQAESKKTEEPEPSSSDDHFTVTEEVKNVSELSATVEQSPDQILGSLSTIGAAFFSGETKWPDGIGIALTIENDSIDLRALFVNEPGEKSDVVPFLSNLIPGPPIVPESPNILPADSELVATMSLDLPQIYAAMSKPRPTSMVIRGRGDNQTDEELAIEPPFAALEKKLKLSVRDDILPLLGSEVALRLPVTGFDLFGLPRGPSPAPDAKDGQPPAGASPVLLISLRDKEAVRALMPKIVDGLGFKGASSFAQTERKEDTEIVSYVNLFSYAFVGNFIVLSTDPATIRYVVDSYLKHETLASDSYYRSFTRWQPRPAHGQIYISPALMESYKGWAEQTKQISEPTRAFLTRLTSVAHPITYSLSNEGQGPLHELHLPKNLVLMAIAGISGEGNAPSDYRNEGMATGLMYSIAHTQEMYKKEKGAGSYGTLEQLVAADLFPKGLIEDSLYKFELIVTSDKFEVYATPKEYGKGGKMSYYIDQTRVLRGADRGGAPATSSDPPIR